jgi:hypothetical protein
MKICINDICLKSIKGFKNKCVHCDGISLCVEFEASSDKLVEA